MSQLDRQRVLWDALRREADVRQDKARAKWHKASGSDPDRIGTSATVPDAPFSSPDAQNDYIAYLELT